MLTFQNVYRSIFFMCLLICAPSFIYSDDFPESFDDINRISELNKNEAINKKIIKEVNKTWLKKCKKPVKFSYYLYTQDFIKSFIEIPSSNVSGESSTISSKYLAGRAPVYNVLNEKVGTCSASFLCMQNEEGIYTDISNYLSVDSGLIISWFTPSTLINLELDSIIHSMVTKCIVVASTKIGFNPFYGKSFDMIVSSDDEKIYFKLTEL